MSRAPHPVTPDGRYFVVGERLWRRTDPRLPEAERAAWTRALMRARGDVRRAASEAQLREARARVHEAKLRLGERGPVWWDDGAPDVNRRHPRNTAYAAWWASLPGGGRG